MIKKGFYLIAITALLHSSVSAQSVRTARAYWDVFKTIPKAVEQITDDYKLHGKQKYYYRNGDLREELNYKFNVKEGLQKTYFHNGKINLLVNYKDGERHGEFKEYQYDKETYYLKYEILYENGNPVRKKAYFPNGQLQTKNEINGEVIYYHKNGKLASRAKSTNGLLNGEVIMYDDKGRPTEKRVYDNSKKTGTWEFYDAKGETYRVENYTSGVREREWTHLIQIDTASRELKIVKTKDESNGYITVDMSKNISDDYRIYLYNATAYFSDNNPFVETVLSWGDGLDFSTHSLTYKGFTRFSDLQGRVIAEGQFEDGSKKGVWRYYNENGEVTRLENHKWINGDIRVETKTKAEIEAGERKFKQVIEEGKAFVSKSIAEIDTSDINRLIKRTESLYQINPSATEIEQNLKSLNSLYPKWYVHRSEIEESRADSIFKLGDYELAYDVYSGAKQLNPKNESLTAKLSECKKLRQEEYERQQVAAQKYDELAVQLEREEMDIYRIYNTSNELQNTVSSYSGGLLNPGSSDRTFDGYKKVVAHMKQSIKEDKNVYSRLQKMEQLIQLHQNMKKFKEGKTRKLEKALKGVSDIEIIKEYLMVKGLELVE